MPRFKTKLLNATDGGRISEVVFVFVATTTVQLVFLISVLIISLFAGMRFLFFVPVSFFFPPNSTNCRTRQPRLKADVEHPKRYRRLSPRMFRGRNKALAIMAGVCLSAQASGLTCRSKIKKNGFNFSHLRKCAC